ncbi:hypothetical protein GCM10018772_62140 [Streptomyces fumanus]|uniref:Uncharacterized protein n=1 Tax=Streptomyces fumanus TaxID=67302 RepID=A0A919E9U4_9ACTN|nr:hypothetical protein GCM10018772_62140 [Streptomyces fumanus]
MPATTTVRAVHSSRAARRQGASLLLPPLVRSDLPCGRGDAGGVPDILAAAGPARWRASQVSAHRAGPGEGFGLGREVEGQAAGAFAAAGAVAGAEPDVDAAVAPAGAVVGDGDLGAGLRNLLFVEEVRALRGGVQALAENRGAGVDGLGVDLAGHGGALGLDLAAVAGDVHRDEGDPVAGDRGHGQVGEGGQRYGLGGVVRGEQQPVLIQLRARRELHGQPVVVGPVRQLDRHQLRLHEVRQMAEQPSVTAQRVAQDHHLLPAAASP